MCSADDDPTTYDLPRRPACERQIWVRGAQRPCGMEFGVTSWDDETGRRHTACRHHLSEIRHRYPEAIPA